MSRLAGLSPALERRLQEFAASNAQALESQKQRLLGLVGKGQDALVDGVISFGLWQRRTFWQNKPHLDDVINGEVRTHIRNGISNPLTLLRTNRGIVAELGVPADELIASLPPDENPTEAPVTAFGLGGNVMMNATFISVGSVLVCAPGPASKSVGAVMIALAWFLFFAQG